MTISFEIPREHVDKWPPFTDGCETCRASGFDGTVVPHATITDGDTLMAFYHHGRCGMQWHTYFSAQWDHTWRRVEGGGPKSIGSRALPALSPTTPTCTLTHAEHMAAWQSWRDDCNGEGGCGFAMRDVDQCDRGHPDDGVLWCGACGYEAAELSA